VIPWYYAVLRADSHTGWCNPSATRALSRTRKSRRVELSFVTWTRRGSSSDIVRSCVMRSWRALQERERESHMRASRSKVSSILYLHFSRLLSYLCYSLLFFSFFIISFAHFLRVSSESALIVPYRPPYPAAYLISPRYALARKLPSKSARICVPTGDGAATRSCHAIYVHGVSISRARNHK